MLLVSFIAPASPLHAVLRLHTMSGKVRSGLCYRLRKLFSTVQSANKGVEPCFGNLGREFHCQWLYVSQNLRVRVQQWAFKTTAA